MPFFTLHRNHTLRTTKGFTIEFIKGEQVWVPPAVVSDAVAIGAVSDEKVEVLESEIQPVSSISPEEREKALFDAFEVLLARNDRGDFTASGLPHSKKLSEICGFEIGNRERDAAWMVYTQNKAEAE